MILFRYREQNLVCPPSLSYDVFTCAAVDNIDHNTSSTSAKSSFHGTAITLSQFDYGKGTYSAFFKYQSPPFLIGVQYIFNMVLFLFFRSSTTPALFDN